MITNSLERERRALCKGSVICGPSLREDEKKTIRRGRRAPPPHTDTSRDSVWSPVSPEKEPFGDLIQGHNPALTRARPCASACGREARLIRDSYT